MNNEEYDQYGYPIRRQQQQGYQQQPNSPQPQPQYNQQGYQQQPQPQPQYNQQQPQYNQQFSGQPVSNIPNNQIPPMNQRFSGQDAGWQNYDQRIPPSPMPPRDVWQPHLQQQPVYPQQYQGNPPAGSPPKVAPPQPPVKPEPPKTKKKTMFYVLIGLVILSVIGFLTTLAIFFVKF